MSFIAPINNIKFFLKVSFKKTLPMKLKNTIVLAIILCVASITQLNAQLVIQEGLTAEEMANLVTGNGVTILNPQVTGADGSYGGFQATGVDDFTLQNGVLLTTGKAIDAVGPNLDNAKTTVYNPSINSPVLELITDSLTTNDACKLEFDFIPDGDTISFSFSFASEEYNEFVCTPYDDIFGFFISGPGIVGDPGMGGRKNIALLPGTNQPVTINTVNSGNPASDVPCPPVNQQFHVVNPISPFADIQYDGWTTGLEAIAGGLQPCETYHLEIIIADVNDRAYDSGVFIEAIQSNNVQVDVTTVGNTETMIEGCNDGTISFCSTEPVLSDLTLSFFLSGTAVNGVDYDPIGDVDPNVPKTIVIPAGQSCVSLDINTIDDGVVEGEEFIDIVLINPICNDLVSDSVRAFILDSLSVEIVANTNVCPGESVVLSVVGDAETYDWGPASLDFIPNNNIANPIVELYETTTIEVTTTLAACTATDEFEVEVVDIDITPTIVPNACSADSCNGAIQIDVTGGLLPYTFDWGTGDTTAFVDGLCAGEYTITVNDAQGCTRRDTIEIEALPFLDVQLSAFEYAGGFNISCFGESDGQITAVISGGSGNYTIEWDDPANSDGLVLDNVPAGTYTITVTDEEGCIVEQSITLSQPDDLVLAEVSVVPVICSGNTGEGEVSVTGGTPNYTITWMLDGNVAGSGLTADNLEAGTYDVTVVDQNLCSTTIQVVIPGPDAPLQGTIVDQENISCNGAADGSVTVSGVDGFLNLGSDYSYLWQDDNSTDPTRDNLDEGTYIVEITDDNNCMVEVEVVITEPDVLGISVIQAPNLSCASDDCTIIEVLGTGGTPNYVYQWVSQPGAVPVGNTSALEVCTQGIYEVTVTDVNDCVETQSFTVTAASPPISINANITDVDCDGELTGAIDVTINGGTPPFNIIEWTSDCGQGPFTTEDISGICAGEWTLFVEDALGCQETFVLTVIEESNIAITFDMAPTLCVDDMSGGLDITPTGGVGDYTYQWFGPAPFIGGPFDFGDVIATTEDITGRPKGEYLVIVTDENGCEQWQEMIITAPAAIDITADNILDYNGFGVSCFGSCDGGIEVTVSGGTVVPIGDYTFVWSDQGSGFEQTTIGPGTEDISGLCASVDANGYQLAVIDDNDCIQTAFFPITSPDEIELDFDVTNPSCDGDVNGSITVLLTGGVPGYTYEWREGADPLLPIFSLQPTINGLDEGTYCVTVTDANGCSVTDCVTLITPDELVVNLDAIVDINGFEVSCPGFLNGVITTDVMGGDGNYNYEWSQCGQPPFADGIFPSLSGLGVGDYCLIVTDGNGCTGSGNITLNSPTLIESAGDVTDISCGGTDDGSINLNLSGGSGVYPGVVWFPSGIVPDGTQNATGLPANNYVITVTDSYGCSQQFTYEVLESQDINVTLTSPLMSNGFNVSCFGECDASLTANILGGSNPNITWTGPAPVGGATGNPTTFTDVVCAGTYTVTVTEDGCTGSDQITITEPPALDVDFTILQDISCTDDCNGQLQAVASGGGGGYVYQWDGFPAGPITPATLCAQEYCVTVTDVNNCSITECFTLTNPAPLMIDFAISDITCNALCDGQLTALPSGGTGAYTYFWTGPDSFEDSVATVINLCAGEYTVEITDDAGCTETASINLVEPAPLDIEIEVSDYNGTSISCFGQCDGFINVTDVNGVNPSFTWEGPGDPAPGANITDLCEGTYILTTSTGGTCTRVDTVVLTQPEQIVVGLESPLFPGGTNIGCNGEATGSITSEITGALGDPSYFWIFEDDTISNEVGTIDQLVAGTYTLLIVDANSCEGTASITLTEPLQSITAVTDPFEYENGFNTSCFGACDGSINTVVTNEVGTVDYFWTGPDFTSDQSDITDLCQGTYVLVVTDENECVFTVQNTITTAPELEILSDVSNALCFGQESGVIDITVLGGVPSYNFTWTGEIESNEQNLTGVGAGSYFLMVTDSFGCAAVDSFMITQPDTTVITLTPSIYYEDPEYNISVPNGTDGTLNATVVGGTLPYTYQWVGPTGIIGVNDSVLTDLIAGQYCLNVIDGNNCLIGSCIELFAPPELWLPNGLSPNGDGMNDGLIIPGLEIHPENNIKIFNRWGNIVHEEDDYSNSDPWMGMGRDNNFVPDGTYFVIVNIPSSIKELHGYLEVRR